MTKYGRLFVIMSGAFKRQQLYAGSLDDSQEPHMVSNNW